MAEFLVVNRAEELEDRAGWFNGDIVCVRPDGQVWGTGSFKRCRLVQRPDIPMEVARGLDVNGINEASSRYRITDAGNFFDKALLVEVEDPADRPAYIAREMRNG